MREHAQVTTTDGDTDWRAAIPDDDITTTVDTPGARDRTAHRYVREVVDAKGPSDEPVLDEVEYVRYITADMRRRRKQTLDTSARAAIPR